jgi:hypothetical protein
MMSRCRTLEKYLEEFVDENIQSDAEELKLIVTDQQAQTLGYFLVNGLAGFVECHRFHYSTIISHRSLNAHI